MARVTGLEPATSGVTGRRSNQLSYTRIWLGAAQLSDGRAAVNTRIQIFTPILSIGMCGTFACWRTAEGYPHLGTSNSIPTHRHTHITSVDSRES